MLLDANNIASQVQAIYLSQTGVGTVFITFNFAFAKEIFPIPISRGTYTYSQLLQHVIFVARQYLSNCRKITATFGDETSNFDSSFYIFDGFSLNRTKETLKTKSFNKHLMGLGINGNGQTTS